MKRFIFLALIFVSVSALAATVVHADCSPASTGNDDNIICTGTTTGDVSGGDGDDIITNNGTITDDIEGNDGNDTLINNGTVDDMFGDDGDDTLINNGTVDDEMRGEDGNDLLINNGYVDDDIEGDDGNDTIINNGYVHDDIRGDDGNDVIINNGVVNGSSGIPQSDGILAGEGDDIIINNGVVYDNINAGNGNDSVTIGNGSFVGGTIVGGDGFDTLIFDVSACFETDADVINAVLSIPDLDPNSDSVTFNGNTYTWVEFEELVATLLAQFCDGRHEIFDTGTPLVSYCNIFNGLDIYDVNEIGVDGRSTEGLLTIRTTQVEARTAVQTAISTGVNQLISTDDYGNQLWALSSNELQIMGPEVTDPTKTYTFILPASVCGIN